MLRIAFQELEMTILAAEKMTIFEIDPQGSDLAEYPKKSVDLPAVSSE